MKTLLILIILIMPLHVMAAPKLLVGMYTLHTPAVCDHNRDSCGELNTDNQLIVVATDNVVIGRMINSYGRESFVLGIKKTKTYGHFTIDYGVIAASGYPKYALAGGRPTDFSQNVVVGGPLLSLGYRLNKFISFEAVTQGTAVNFAIGLSL